MEEHRCLRCNHFWVARKEGRPMLCPSCKSIYWDKLTVRETRREKELREENERLKARIKEWEQLLKEKEG